jgi:hypothetical protein
MPVPSQRWHLTTLSPFFRVPLPSQFLHFCFFGPAGFGILVLPESTAAARSGARGRPVVSIRARRCTPCRGIALPQGITI